MARRSTVPLADNRLTANLWPRPKNKEYPMKISPVACLALIVGVLVFSSVAVAQNAQRPKNDPSQSIPASRFAVLSKNLGTGGPAPKHVGTKGGPDPTWYGYSVGHWDGDNTLVIETTGSDDSEWLDPRGYPHSLQGVFEERYTRVDHNHLEMTVTVDDPKIYTKPFVLGTSKFVWVPSQESEEQICVPSEAISYVNLISIPVAGEKEQ